MVQPLVDSFGRRISYLRLSVTDRCNLRCVYCLPELFTSFAAPKDILTDDEIVKLLSCFAALGVSKIRITGGEPLVRAGIVDLIGRFSQIKGISDVSLSTNGLLLDRMANALANAGLQRINVSLDSLNPEKFHRITRFGHVASVLAGLDAALAAGLSPVKLNVVVVRGMNDDEIGDFVTLTERRPIHVRFIELMPMGETGFFSKARWVPLEEMMERASPLTPLVRDEWPEGYGPARYYKRSDARGTIGFISPLSCGFCASCNRVRLSAQGRLVPCLDGDDGVDLKTPLRQGASEETIKVLIRQAIQDKPERHFMIERTHHPCCSSPRLMCQIGG